MTDWDALFDEIAADTPTQSWVDQRAALPAPRFQPDNFGTPQPTVAGHGPRNSYGIVKPGPTKFTSGHVSVSVNDTDLSRFVRSVQLDVVNGWRRTRSPFANYTPFPRIDRLENLWRERWAHIGNTLERAAEAAWDRDDR